MSIVQDMDAEFVAGRPFPPGTAWLIGGNIWHAVMADLARINRDNGGPKMDLSTPPRELFGLPLRHVPRMSGWGLAVALDPEAAMAQECASRELTPRGQTQAP